MHGQPGAQPDGLDRSGDPELGQVVGMMPTQDPAAVTDRARARVDKAADHVEQGRFSCAVRSDDADDLAVADCHRHVGEGQQTAEADADFIDQEERRVGLLSLPGFGWRSRGLEDRAHRKDYPGREAASINAERAPRAVMLYQPPGIASDVTAFDLRVPGSSRRKRPAALTRSAFGPTEPPYGAGKPVADSNTGTKNTPRRSSTSLEIARPGNGTLRCVASSPALGDVQSGAGLQSST